MTVISSNEYRKITAQDNYVRMHNSLFLAMPFEQSGLLGYLLTKPDGWAFSCERIARETGAGLHTVRRIRKALADLGYVRTINVRSDDGKLRRTTWVRDSLTTPWPDEPQTGEPADGTEVVSTECGAHQTRQKPSAGNTALGKPRAVSKKEIPSKTEKSKKENTCASVRNLTETDDEQLALVAPPTRTGDGFDEWWKLYPRKIDRKKAHTAYTRAVRAGITPERMVAALEAWVAYWTQSGAIVGGKATQFVKHPTTWLNGECWGEQPEPAVAATRLDAVAAERAKHVHSNVGQYAGDPF
jgi:hypothetical protein